MQRYSKSSEIQNKLVKIGYFEKKTLKSFGVSRKSSTFAAANQKNDFGVWCNGNTTDSGPVILGSSPSTPTQKIARLFTVKHLATFLIE